MLFQPISIIKSQSVIQAQMVNSPIVALESTVISHGLPWPENLNLAIEMENIIRAENATPATIAVLNGKVYAGLQPEQLHTLATCQNSRKISLRDFGIALADRLSGGTTVAATLHIAERAGIYVFATGGIGGVHRNAPFDISADLPKLGSTPVIVVCAGAKSILDIPATLEYLETQGVPVVGYRTSSFPAFYSIDSGLKVDIQADSPEEVANIARHHWGLGLRSAILLVVPPPQDSAIPLNQMESIIQQALTDAEQAGIRGSKVTPFLLARVSELSTGESMKANLALLLNNAAVAAKISAHLVGERTDISNI